LKLNHLIQGIDVVDQIRTFSGDVEQICYNSNQCSAGSLFVAVRGMKFDGHHYIPQAISHGAKFIVCENDYSPPAGVTVIRVKDGRRALGILGKNFYQHPSARLCLAGIVGTNGKTTITYLLESIFKTAGFRTGVLGTVNYRYNDTVRPAPNTTPESIEMQKILWEMAQEGVTHVVSEVSSHSLDLKRVDDCDFDIGVFTNFSQDHLDYHLTMENYFRAKERFFTEVLPRSAKKRKYGMIVNADDPWGQKLIRDAKVSSLTFGIVSPADIHAEEFRLTIEGIEAGVSIRGKRFDIKSALIGQFNLSNILAAVAAAVALDIPVDRIRDGVGALKNVPGRLERVEGSRDIKVFVDYAHTEDALRRVLENLSEFREKRLITVFGCGGDRDRGKRPLMGAAATSFSDLAIITSDNPRTEDPLAIIGAIETGIPSGSVSKLNAASLCLPSDRRGYAVIPDRKTAITAAIASAQPGDVVLIAGKGHEDYQILGDRKIFFDDRFVAAEVLKSVSGGGPFD
jgi:UDP-N-acetylmuramoyl-L-alanyl-D-glutamate--2,6-diaminopimelate ligase